METLQLERFVDDPRQGAEQLITRLLGFRIEKHDDAVNALVYLILGVIGMDLRSRKSITFKRACRYSLPAAQSP